MSGSFSGVPNFVDLSTNQSVGGIKTFSNTTDATSNTSGGTIVSGGLAVAKSINTGSSSSTHVINGTLNLATTGLSVIHNIAGNVVIGTNNAYSHTINGAIQINGNLNAGYNSGFTHTLQGSLNLASTNITHTLNGTCNFTKAIITAGRRSALTTRSQASYTVQSTDEIILVDCTPGNRAIVLLSAATAGIGAVFTIKKIDPTANICTITTTSSQTIDDALTQTLSTQWDAISVVSNGSNWFII